MKKALVFIISNLIFVSNTFATPIFIEKNFKGFVKPLYIGSICLVDNETKRIRVCNDYGLYIEDFTLLPEDREHIKEIKQKIRNCYKFLKTKLQLNKKVKLIPNPEKFILETESFEEKIDKVLKKAEIKECKDVIIQVWN